MWVGGIRSSHEDKQRGATRKKIAAISRTMPKGTTTRNKNLGSFLARLTKCQPREFAVPIYNKSMYKNYQHMKKKKKKKKKREKKSIVSVRSPKLMGKRWYLSFQHTKHTEKWNGRKHWIAFLFSDLFIWHPHQRRPFFFLLVVCLLHRFLRGKGSKGSEKWETTSVFTTREKLAHVPAANEDRRGKHHSK